MLPMFACLAFHAIAENQASPKKGSEEIPIWAVGAAMPSEETLKYPDGHLSIMVSRASFKPGEYSFLHDPTIVEYKNGLFAAWYNCPKAEMQETSVIRGSRSQDGGKTWSAPEMIASDKDNKGIMYVPVALINHKDKLYAFVTNMKGGVDLVHDCEIFLLDEEAKQWKSQGFLGSPFLPNTPPRKMPDGNFIMAGRVASEAGKMPKIPAVAISDGDNLTGKWKIVKLLPGGLLPGGEEPDCPETTLVIDEKEMTAFVRGQYSKKLDDNSRPFVFKSTDNGQTWSEPVKGNLPMGAAKIYAGKLSTGQRYILYNLPSKPRRNIIVLTVSKPGETQFIKAWKLCDGINAELKAKPEYAYPSALESNGKLYVVYSAMKRNCIMSVIPIDSLGAKE